MGVLDRMILGGGLQAATPSPDSDFWYQPVGAPTLSGMTVSDEAAKKISAWYRGRDILATVFAMLPLQVFERLPNDGGSQQAKSNPLYDILHDKPNDWQDSFQWRRQKMYHLIDHGNAYDFIVSGRRGFVDQLRPIHPRCVTVRQSSSGRLLYDVRDPKLGTTKTYTQDEIFHLRGASEDGITGKGILEYARTSIGTALAVESYAAAIFGKGTLNGGTVSVPGLLNEEASKRMANSMRTSVGDWAMPKVLEQGATWTPNDMSPEDFQMLLSRKFSIDEMARWLGIPRQMLENNDPSFGNAEQFDRNFMAYSMGPWLSLAEFAMNDQLVVSPRVFVEFNRLAIVRSDIAAQATADVEYVNAGIRSVDEVRGQNNWNKRGGKADELREPQNITGKPRAEEPNEPSSKPPTNKQAEKIAQASAQRLIRKEITAVQALAKKYANDSAKFQAAVKHFYAEHVALVAATLQIPAARAQEYCRDHAERASSASWVNALTQLSSDSYAAEIAAMALEAAA